MLSFEVLYPIGAALILAAIAYGVMRNRSRTTSEKQKTEDATRRVYAQEEADRRKVDKDSH